MNKVDPVARAQQMQQMRLDQAKALGLEGDALTRYALTNSLPSNFGAPNGGAEATYGRSGSIVQGNDGQFYTVQFGSDGSRRILPLTAGQGAPQQAPSEAPMNFAGGVASDPNVAQSRLGVAAPQAQPQQQQPAGVALSPAKGVRTIDTGTEIITLDSATGEEVSRTKKNLAEAEEQKGLGKYNVEQRKIFGKSRAAVKALKASRDTFKRTAARVVQFIKANPNAVGFLGTAQAQIPGSPAYNLGQLIGTLKARAGFQELENMRANSPTGGALGQVTERELAFLQSATASLDQGQQAGQLLENIAEIQRVMDESDAARMEAFKTDFADFLPGSQRKAAPQQQKVRRYNPQTGQLE